MEDARDRLRHLRAHGPALNLRHGDPALRDHLIHGNQVAVGVTFVSLALNAQFERNPSAHSVALSHVIFVDPINVPRDAQVKFRVEEESAKGKISGHLEPGGTKPVATYRVAEAEALSTTLFWQEGEEVAVPTLYEANPHVTWGPWFQTIDRAVITHDTAMLTLKPIEAMSGIADPRLLNSILFGAFALSKPGRKVCDWLPLSIDKVVAARVRPKGPLFVVVKRNRSSGELSIFDAEIQDHAGCCVVRFEAFALKQMARTTHTAAEDMASQAFDTPAQAQSIGEFLADYVCSVLDIEAFDHHQNLLDLGMDSKALMQMSDTLADRLDIDIMPTLFFEYPSVHLLAEYFSENHTEAFAHHSNDSQTALVSVPTAKRTQSVTGSLPHDSPIAIIGMAGQLAKSEDLDAFWRNISTQQSMIDEIPQDRWDIEEWYSEDREADGRTYCKWGSFIDNIAGFDPLFFNISPQQATWLDPQVRKLLEVAYHAAEDAGVVRSMRGSSTGVYAGVCFQEYWDEIIRNDIPLTGHEHASSHRSSVAAHVSYALDLRGPSIPLDNACASSLTALHMACQALRNGECDMAFACGTNLLISPLQYVYFSRIQAMSPTGRCHTFDARANGFVPGEGAIALLLKPLDAAVRDNDPVHAVIRGSAINHTGRAPNPTSPRPETQIELLRTAWARAGIKPSELSYLECHGTGTQLGDPIEFNALKKAFADTTTQAERCVIGSVKAHLGHLEGAAGLASVVSVVKAMHHKTIPAMPDVGDINPLIKLDGSPFTILRENQLWHSRSGQYIAGVSGFGMTGNGAHVVIAATDEHNRDQSLSHGPQLLLFSAKTPERLRSQLEHFYKFFTVSKTSLWLPDIAYTLLTGRETFRSRLAIVAQDLDDLDKQIKGYLAGSDYPLSEHRFNKHIKAWQAGGDINLVSLEFPEMADARRISLPGYNFSGDRYWFEPKQKTRDLPSAPRPDLSELMVIPSWVPVSLPTGAPTVAPNQALIVATPADRFIAEALAGYCKMAQIVTPEQCGHVALSFDAPDTLIIIGSDEDELHIFTALQRLGAELAQGQRLDTFILSHISRKTGAGGLGFALAQGDTRFRVRNIEITGAVTDDLAARILQEPASPRGDQIQLGPTGRSQRYFEPFSLPVDKDQRPIKTCGTYLIVGGAGAVGKVLSKWLIHSHQAKVIWLGRREEAQVSSDIETIADPLNKLTYYRCDATDSTSLANALQVITAKHGDLNGVIFAPVVFSFNDGISETTPEQFRSILEAKTKGSSAFIETFQTLTLDFMIFFSSCQAFSFTSSAHLSGYAAGIAHSDRLATTAMRELNTPVGILNWGFWETFTKTDLWRDYIQEFPDAGKADNIAFLSDEEGIACFEQFAGSLMQDGPTQLACLRQSTAVKSLIMEAARFPKLVATTDALPSANTLPLDNLEYMLKNLLSDVLKLDPAQIEQDVTFSEYGIDSITTASFITKLNINCGSEMSTTLLYDYPTLAELKSVLSTMHLPLIATVQPPELFPSKPTMSEVSYCDTDIAIIGLSLEVPQARTADAFWELLKDGLVATGPIPQERVSKNMTGTCNAGVLSKRDWFDPLFFNISPKETKAMSPYQRLTLKEAWRCLESAGINPKTLAQSKTGVFIGAEPASFDKTSLTGGSEALIAARISYFLNLKGPAFVVNTGCSSSGVALHQACESLRHRESDLALAGGIFADVGDEVLRLLAGIGMLSPNGLCRPFSAQSDGTIISEGVGLVALKRLKDAMADGDPIRAVIRASGVNQDGASNGITAPNGTAQEALLRNVYETFKISASQIELVEAHGTGTRLGDPIEVNTLSRVLQPAKREHGIYLGTAKANIGHTSAASGVIGLIKLVLSMEHKTIPRLPGFDRLNPKIDPLGWQISAASQSWQPAPDHPRLAALSSFGHSGTNTHFVVQEASLDASVTSTSMQLVPLSAKQGGQLQAQAENLLAALRKRPDLSLASVAWTLQSGRQPWQQRVCFVVNSIESLCDELMRYLKGELPTEQEAPKALLEAAGYWQSGGDVSWLSLQNNTPPRRIDLPGTVFDEKPFGLPVKEPALKPPTPENLLRVPVWQESSKPQMQPLQTGKVLILATEPSDPVAQKLKLAEERLGNFAMIAPLCEQMDVSGIVRLYILSWQRPHQGSSLEGQLIGTIRALRARVAVDVPLDLFVLTRTGQIGAGSAGFAYALAQSDHRLAVRNIELPDVTVESEIELILAEPGNARGTKIQLREGARFTQIYPTVDITDAESLPSFRRHGRYIIAGGAGTVGSVISRFLTQDYNAKVYWFGRSPISGPKVQRRLAEFGDDVCYVQTDVTNIDALHEALAVVRRDGPIDGAIFSSLVFEFDDTLDALDYDRFQSIFDVKLRGSANFFRALQDEPLDFLTYFSSGQAFSFSGATQFASYAAAMTAADAICTELATQSQYPVGILNWGFWKASQENQRVATNIAFIEDHEGFAALKAFVAYLRAGACQHSLAMRPSSAVKLLMPGVDKTVNLGETKPTRLSVAQLAQLQRTEKPTGLDDWMPRLALAALQSLGVIQQHLKDDVDQLLIKSEILPKYKRWLIEVLSQIEKTQLICSTGATQLDFEQEFENFNTFVLEHAHRPHWKTNLELLQICMRDLGAVLTGSKAATEVLFPSGSLDKVAAAYSGTPLFDALNDQVAVQIEAVVSGCSQGTKARILEIGAGTGGTTCRILPMLGPNAAVETYQFTDLSQSFLVRAQTRFGEYPYFKTAIYDVNTELTSAMLTPGSFDLVVATNVLHATHDIARTLENAKSALRPGGEIIINEITQNDLFGTLTFGLLDGWWLYDDPDCRLPGAPLLSPDGWAKQLEQAGFVDLQFLAGAPDQPGHHVIRAAVPMLKESKNESVKQSNLDQVQNIVRAALSEATELEPSQIEETVALSDYGIDSILGIRFIEEINQRLSLSLNPAIVFEYATVKRLSQYITSLAPKSAAQIVRLATPAPSIKKPFSLRNDLIAIVGMAGQVPGACNIDTFWENLASGKDSLGPLSPTYMQGRSDEMRQFDVGGTLINRDQFDPLFFTLTPHEAASMSPHQRLILQEGWKALEDAAIDPTSLSGANIGVYVGAEPSGYRHQSFTGQSDALVASRLSYILNLRGPALALNTGCSSSGVSIHLACEALRSGEIEVALAGGVCANLDTPEVMNLLGVGMLSPSGECLAFSAGADGTVMSEAVGMVVLKRLDAAERDGDPIYACIAASGTNQDGSSNGITAPNGEAQEELITQTYARFKIDPEQISYVESHGTGTKLGDVVEANALTRAFAQFTNKRHFCAVGAIKPIIGHSSAAAGVIGLINVVQSMRHCKRLGLRHLSDLNPLITDDSSALNFSQQTLDWPVQETPRFAALNCFGHSGTNAHLVVQDYTRQQAFETTQPQKPVLIPLSARTKTLLDAHVSQLHHDLTALQGRPQPDELQHLIAQIISLSPQDISEHETLLDLGLGAAEQMELREHLQARYGSRSPFSGQETISCLTKQLVPAIALDGNVSWLSSVAKTLQVGRAALSERCVVLANSQADLIEKLSQMMAGDMDDPKVWFGTAGSSHTRLSDQSELSEIAQHWVRGGKVNWQIQKQAFDPFAQRLHLSPTIFANETYRKPIQENSAQNGLLGRMLPSLDGQHFISQISQTHPIIAQHKVGGAVVLPAATGLEMAITAVLLTSTAELQNVVLHHVSFASFVTLGAEPVSLRTELERGAGGQPGSDMTLRISSDQDWLFAEVSTDAAPLAIEWPDESRYAPEISKEEFYSKVAQSGVNLGVAFQNVSKVHHSISSDAHGKIVHLEIAPNLLEDQDAHPPHTCMIDAVLQTVMALDGNAQTPQYPFSIEALTFWRRSKQRSASNEMKVWIKPDKTAQNGFEALLVNAQNLPLLHIRGLVMRTAQSTGPTLSHALLRPIWERYQLNCAEPDSPSTLIAGDLGGKSVLDLAPLQARSVQQLPWSAASHSTNLDCQDIDHIIWIASMGKPKDDPYDPELHSEAILSFFGFVKHMLHCGLDTKSIRWTIVTRGGALVIPGEAVTPAHAGLHGLVGSVSKEMPEWSFKTLDLPRQNLQANIPISNITDAPDLLAFREKDWFTRSLAPFNTIKQPAASFPTTGPGVIVIIGGAGGIAAEWTKSLPAGQDWQVAWIGRTPHSPDIDSKITAATQPGDTLRYFQADASNPAQLAQAVSDIKASMGSIRGVVHSAITLTDKTVSQMSERQLCDALLPKLNATLALAKCFHDEALEFVLFFSSVQSFLTMPGQGNYAAGSCFIDLYAELLRKSLNCSVKVMNWGYWGRVGIVADDANRQRASEAGVRSIEPAEGWEALNQLMALPTDQLAFLPGSRSEILSLPIDDQQLVMTHEQAFTPNFLQNLEISLPKDGSAWAYIHSGGDFRMAPMEPLLLDILIAQLRELGLEDIAEPSGVPQPYLRRWLRHVGDFVDIHSHATPSLDTAWQAWDNSKAVWLAEPSRCAQVTLAEAALRDLPTILSGQKPATSVLMPNGALDLVEEVYSDNLAAQYFNQVLASAFISLVRQRAHRPLRILEIGAGTGATSATLFQAISDNGLTQAIEEYRYTDISRTFLAHAKRRFAANVPYLQTGLLDADRPLTDQGYEIGSYDIVVAANSLHTTSDIRRTIKHVKSALKPGGMVLLNEITEPTLYGHVTFGLLEGWWRFDDPSIRFCGSPGLPEESWSHVMRHAGFGEPVFPTKDHHDLGLQIILAQSDGLILTQQKTLVPLMCSRTHQSTPTIHKEVPKMSLNQFTQNLLIDLIVQATGLPESEINPAKGFDSYGIDSIVVIDLAKRLREHLPGAGTTLFFECQTVETLTRHLVESRGDELAMLVRAKGQKRVIAEPASQAMTELNVAEPHPRDAIAIIGADCHFPMAPNLDAFWSNLIAGKNCIGEVPADRWAWQDYYHAKPGTKGATSTKWGGYLNDIAQFDPLFFNISPVEAEGINPQERLFLQAAWKCVEEAGYTPEGLNTLGCVGVFAGVMNDTYHNGAKHWSVANRVSYQCDFQGPSLAVDTACSSSLTALHLAIESLLAGSSRTALAGGVNLITNPQHSISLSQLRVLSGDDRNKTFCEHADGFIDAEGVGVVLLKRLEDAIRDGDHIHAVVLGSAINAGGKVNGYTVPNPKAQERVVRTAISKAGIDPATVSYVEAHGTGTVLGDPIEVRALSQAFDQPPKAARSCAIGSVKSNIGHAESAAGIAGLLKVVLQMKHKTLVPSLHSGPLNPEIDFESSPFFVNQTASPWVSPDGVCPLRAGLSSFGAGGANAHIVLEEAPSIAALAQFDGDLQLVVLSAQSEAQIRAYAGTMAALMSWSLYDLARTLQSGRVAFEYRLAIVTSSKTDLAAQLSAFAEGKSTLFKGWFGKAENANSANNDADFLPEPSDLPRVAARWVVGEQIDWNALADNKPFQRVSLPTYPFAKERHWAPELPMPKPIATQAVVKSHSLHQSFDFREDVAALSDHMLDGAAVLPGVGYLQCCWQLMNDTDPAAHVSFSDVIWIAPFFSAQSELQLEIAIGASQQGKFQFWSQQGGNRVDHCQGRITLLSDQPKEPSYDIVTAMAGCRDHRVLPATLQRAFQQMGVGYSGAHLQLGSVDLGSGQAFAMLKSTANTSQTKPLDVGLLDSALQTCLCMIDGALDETGMKNPPLPFRLDHLDIFSAKGPFEMVHVMEVDTNTTEQCLNLVIASASGEIMLRFKGLRSRVTAQALPDLPIDLDQQIADLLRSFLPEHAAITSFFQPWWKTTQRFLANFPSTNNLSQELLWKRWHSARDNWMADPNLAPRIPLLEAVLPKISTVLTGQYKATDVLFPQSSLDLVDPIYNKNPTADLFNQILVKAVLRHVAAKTPRILEIGAGTGGTTAHLLAAFSEGSSDPSAYVYTDKSKRFVEHGLDRFGKSYAYVEGQCLDIESEPKDQGFAPASFDVIVAANVLHATRNMRTTLAHVRSLLKPGGLLVLNELSDNALYAHVTFGLLDGWWTYDDPELRLEGSPGLSKENWRNLLEETGFSALEYPASQHHGLGQQIITAQAWPAIFRDMEQDISDLNALENNIRNHVSQALKIDPSKIEKDRSFADYGVDSILAVNLVNDIADAVDMPLTTTVIFDYNNVSKLARHLHESSGEVKPALADRSETEKESTNALKRSSKEGLLGEVVRALDSLTLEPEGTILLLTEDPEVKQISRAYCQTHECSVLFAGRSGRGADAEILFVQTSDLMSQIAAHQGSKKIAHIVCHLPSIEESLFEILDDDGKWIDVGDFD